MDTQPSPFVFHGLNVKTPDFLETEKEKVFCIVAMKQYHQEIEEYLNSLGYHEIEDYLFLLHKPMVIEQKQPYTDVYGNTIVGKPGITVSITAYDCKLDIHSNVNEKVGIYACNSSITIEENVIFEEGNIYCHDQCNIYIESKGVFHQIFDLVLYDKSSVYIGEDIRVEPGFRLICGDNSEIKVGKHCRLKMYDTLVSTGYSKLRIGDCCIFQRYLNCSTTFKGIVEIGNGFMCSYYVSIYNNDGHPIYDVTSGKQINSHKNIYIGEHVWAGIKSTILSGADIGISCIIGANSVVNKCFANNCAIAGAPAKVVRMNVTWEITEKDVETIDKRYWNITEQ